MAKDRTTGKMGSKPSGNAKLKGSAFGGSKGPIGKMGGGKKY